MESKNQSTPIAHAEGAPPASNWFEKTQVLGEFSAIFPNALARSSVFSSMPSHAPRKVYTKPTKLATLKNVTIEQVGGSQLTQAEESVWLMLIRRVLRLPVRAPAPGVNKINIEFTPTDLLREMGLPSTSQHRNALRRSILYLGRARFILQLPKHRYEGNLLDVATGVAKGDSQICIWLDVAISGVFTDGWTYLNLEHRHALQKSPLAQWLLSFYSTHSDPFSMTEETLKKLADRESMRQDKWLAVLSSALNKLQAVTNWECILEGQNKVHITKPKTIKGALKHSATVTPTIFEPSPPSVAAAPTTRHRSGRATDEQLLEGWLQSMSRNKLLLQLKWLGLLPSEQGQQVMQAPELRSHLHDAVMAWPNRFESRIARLRAREFL